MFNLGLSRREALRLQLDRLYGPLATVRRPLVWVTTALYKQFRSPHRAMVQTLVRLGVAPQTVLDVGANLGQFAIPASYAWPNAAIHCVEPLPEAVSYLEARARLRPQIHVHPVAVGAAAGTVTLHVNANSGSSSVLPLGDVHRAAFPNAVEAGNITVPIETLDALFADADLRPPILLVIDVQGFEFAVLTGAERLLRSVEWVILEASTRPMYDGERPIGDLLATMQSAGFALQAFVGRLEDPSTGAIVQVDPLFRRVGS